MDYYLASGAADAPSGAADAPSGAADAPSGAAPAGASADDRAAAAALPVQTTATSASAWPVPMMPGYQADRLLGSGASAQVWLVHSNAGGQSLAAKCFLPGSDDDDKGQPVQRKLTRELRILANYSHEHLLNLHAVLPLSPDWGGSWALLMDYAAGGSLADLVAARTRLTVGETVTVLSPLAQVLGYLHDQGVVHGDVAPGNVLFTAEGKPLLADFGVAAMVGDRSQPWLGTDGFVVDGPADGDASGSSLVLDPAADVYAMAAVGWFALTGQAPPPPASRLPLALHVQGIPEELSEALEAGLQESAALRPSALELGQAIYRSAVALPLDLSFSVHPSVIPELLTRRQLRVEAAGRLRWARLGVRIRAILRGRGLTGTGTGIPSQGWDRTNNRSSVPSRGRGGTGASAGVRNRGWALRRTAGVVAVVLVAAVVVLAWPRANPGPDPTTGSSPARNGAGGTAHSLANLAVPDPIREKLESQDPQRALAGLAWLRSYAFSAGQGGMLEWVDVSGSTALADDRTVATQLEASAHTLAGLETQILTARTLEARSDATVLVKATAVTSGFTEVDRFGTVVRSQPEAATQMLTFVLFRESGYWQIAEVRRAVP
ncbi:serine/threonine protein kinase [Paenarthrobacter sp. Z7-10]|uniref:serine/threonine-protein kinase n=1 Tax=Paenarthrobacter sp. Z7-10 TaxID=2787635 RepID=UPI0022A98E05|nr:serine/threonine-protein kinase [Paenarthrobacter sp. Z7-10]MCZ2402387.1 serine/threonine protein kinase [Paenarthrobacter sp. Z7-10]